MLEAALARQNDTQLHVRPGAGNEEALQRKSLEPPDNESGICTPMVGSPDSAHRP